MEPSHNFKPGQTVVLDDAGTVPVFYVARGTVASYIHTARGDRVFDSLYPQGTGYIPLSPEDMEGYTPNSRESAYKSFMALTEAEVMFNRPPLRTQVVAQSIYSGFFFGQMRTLDAWRGVLFFILEFGQRNDNGTVSISLLQSLIGDVIGYTRESVSNAISMLKQKGLVATYKERSTPVIVLLDERRARDLVFTREEH